MKSGDHADVCTVRERAHGPSPRAQAPLLLALVPGPRLPGRLDARTGQGAWRENKDEQPSPPRSARPATGARADSQRTDAGLSRERIVWTAIRIANAEGLESMSMRHVANVLGVKVMSLYNYIDGKDALIDLMVEAVFSESGDTGPHTPGAGGPSWRPPPGGSGLSTRRTRGSSRSSRRSSRRSFPVSSPASSAAWARSTASAWTPS